MIPRGRYGGIAAACAAALLAMSYAAMAQGSGRAQSHVPLRLVVPFAPGGGSDLVARAIGEKLSTRLNRPVVVDNRPGAGIVVGSNFVAKSPPDGNTILIVTIAHAVNPSLYSELPYDTEKDFTPISRSTDAPMVLVVHPSVQAKSVKELIELARKNPGKLNYATPGNGSPAHLSAEMLKSMAGIDITHVPYKGAGPATADLLGGQVQMTFSSLGVVGGHLKSGALRALGVTSRNRSKALPDVPTIAEAALPGYEVISWQGILGPGDMPKDVLDNLNQALVDVMKDPALIETLAKSGYEAVYSSPDEFRSFISDELKRWRGVVKTIGVRPD